MSRTYVVAEIGSNHGGNLGRMATGIAQAAQAGIDAVKFQWVSSGDKMAERRGAGSEYGSIYQKFIGWPEAWHENLRDWCAESCVDYICTAYLPADVAIVAPYVDRFKVASFEAGDIEMLKAHVPLLDRPIMISAGMMSVTEREELEDRCERLGIDPHLLHCVSAYPAPIEAMQLRWLRGSVYSGLSDHSANVLTGALAVAAGARIIEVHVRVEGQDTSLPDYGHALSPEQFQKYVANIRLAERALGDESSEGAHECEAEMSAYRVLN